MPFCRHALWVLCAVLLPTLGQAQSYTFTQKDGPYVSGNALLRRADGTLVVASSQQIGLVNGRLLTWLAGSWNTGAVDGPAADARFALVSGLAEDASGNLYLADQGNHVIRRLDRNGVVTTFAGQLGAGAGAVDGPAAEARFNSPHGLVIDSTGALYVADTGNHAIRRIAPDGTVSTVAGALQQPGAVDGPAAEARFRSPDGIAVAANGDLYVTDTENHAIRRVRSGAVTTLGGRLGVGGFADGVGSAARFWRPGSLTITPAGDLFVLEPEQGRIRRVTAAGRVDLIYSGSTGVALTSDASGNLYVMMSGIAVGTPSDAVAITLPPMGLQVAAGSPLTLSVSATGAAPLRFQWQKDGVALPGATSPRYRVASVQAGDAGAYTVSVTNDVGVALSPVTQVTVVAAPAHDAFADAAVLNGASGTLEGLMTGATIEDDEPESGRANSWAYAGSIWHRWTAPVAGRVAFTDTAAAWRQPTVYEGTALADLRRVDVQGVFSAVAGREYFIRVSKEDSYGQARYTLEWWTVTNDDFGGARIITTPTGNDVQQTRGATLEPGEPEHATRPGWPVYSLWYTWTVPEAGIVELNGTDAYAGIFIDPAGIEVYTGSELASLTPVTTRSSGRGVAFAAAAGTTYKIALLSRGGLRTVTSLRWSLTKAPVVLGIVATPKETHRLAAGRPLTFEADALSLETPRYQWRFRGEPLDGATGRTLVFPSLTTANAGWYEVVVSNDFGSSVSATVILGVVTPPPNDDFASATLLGGASGSVSGSNVDASGETGEPLHWSYFGNQASLWYRWVPAANGRAAVDTIGSTLDTVLAVYTGNSLSTLTRLVQDDDSGGAQASLVTFSAKAGTEYFIAVGGATSSARGEVRLNWQLDPVLSIVRAPTAQNVAVGGSAQFVVEATGAGATYQWYRNDVALPGETRSILTVANVAPGDDATYTVTVTNSTGSVTSPPATLAVTAPQLTTLTVRSALPGGEMLWGIASGANRLVAVGERGLIVSSGDGQTWQPQTSGVTGWLVGVTYGAGRFVAVGDGGTILVSIDGVQWRPALASGTAERLNNVIYAGGRFVAVGEHGTILTSEDASVWSRRESGVSGWLRGLAYNPTIGQFAASGQNGAFLVSTDGNAWSAVALGDTVGDIEALADVVSYADFVAVGATGAVLAVRQHRLVLKDGSTLTTWAADPSASASSVRFRGLATGANALFASGEGGKVITASDTAGPWVTLPSGTDANLVAGTYFQHRLYLVGQNRTVLESEPLYASRLVNLSTRAAAGPDMATLISGFVVTGTAPKKMLIRAAGPSLGGAPFHLPGVLARPQLTLYNGKGEPLATNASWEASPDSAALAKTVAEIGAFPFQAGNADAGILITLEPGAYTAHTNGVDGTSGLTIVEVYDADPLANETSRAINLSTRGIVGSGANKLILGFIINGASSKRVLIRAAGPALGAAPYHLPGTLARPQLELYNSRNLLRATAGEWGLEANADEIRGVAQAVGAFALPDGSADAAMLVTLLPGAWTVQVGGAENTTGLVIAEVYVLP